MTILQAIFLGLVQGLTEFIPISSTAHLVLASRVMNLTLKPNGYAFSYQPALAGAGFGPTALDYTDSGTGHCQG